MKKRGEERENERERRREREWKRGETVSIVFINPEPLCLIKFPCLWADKFLSGLSNKAPSHRRLFELRKCLCEGLANRLKEVLLTY